MAALLALLFGGITAALQNPSGSWRLNWELTEELPYEETGFAAPPELLLPLERIVLSLTDTSATFYESDGAKRKYLLPGQREHGSFRGFDVDTHARWNGHTLTIELSPQPGLVLVEHYDRCADQLLLSIAVAQAGHRTGPVIRYVYDSVFSHEVPAHDLEPVALPAEGSGPVIFQIVPFEAEGGAPLVDIDTYLYYIHLNLWRAAGLCTSLPLQRTKVLHIPA